MRKRGAVLRPHSLFPIFSRWESLGRKWEGIKKENNPKTDLWTSSVHHHLLGIKSNGRPISSCLPLRKAEGSVLLPFHDSAQPLCL